MCEGLVLSSGCVSEFFKLISDLPKIKSSQKPSKMIIVGVNFSASENIKKSNFMDVWEEHCFHVSSWAGTSPQNVCHGHVDLSVNNWMLMWSILKARDESVSIKTNQWNIYTKTASMKTNQWILRSDVCKITCDTFNLLLETTSVYVTGWFTLNWSLFVETAQVVFVWLPVCPRGYPRCWFCRRRYDWRGVWDNVSARENKHFSCLCRCRYLFTPELWICLHHS